MKKCSKCSEEIQDKAKKCKHCGSDLGNWFTRHKIVTIFLIIFFFIVIISAMDDSDMALEKDTSSFSSNSDSKNGYNSKNNNGDVAAVCAQNKIKTMLKSPSSAKFPWGLTSSLISGNKYKVANYVDSQNSFGAMIRANYVCEVVVINASSFDCNASCIIE